jgi:hypothetical protein
MEAVCSRCTGKWGGGASSGAVLRVLRTEQNRRDELSQVLKCQIIGRWTSCDELEINFFFVRVPPDVISLQLCTPKVIGVQFKLYTVNNLHLKQKTNYGARECRGHNTRRWPLSVLLTVERVLGLPWACFDISLRTGSPEVPRFITHSPKRTGSGTGSSVGPEYNWGATYLEQKVAASVSKVEITAIGDRRPDYATPCYPQKLALTSPTSAARSRAKATELFGR